ncbi:hypothetical protein BPODLACK_04192 [Gordonia sp. YY1]|nr:hypothetical protein BPODLACK_04192 [Gordonia sp. YY1]
MVDQMMHMCHHLMMWMHGMGMMPPMNMHM